MNKHLAEVPFGVRVNVLLVVHQPGPSRGETRAVLLSMYTDVDRVRVVLSECLSTSEFLNR